MHSGVSQYVHGTIPKLVGDKVTQSAISEWVNLDRQALSAICLGVDDQIMYQLKKFSTSKEAWDTLKSLYNKVSNEDVFKLEDELISLDPRSFDSIQYFINKVNELKTSL